MKEVKFRARRRDIENPNIYTLEGFEGIATWRDMARVLENCGEYIGLKDKNGTPIFVGDYIKYTEHKGYLLPNFIAEVVWMNDSACYGYKRNDVPEWSRPTPFVKHDELQADFFNYIEVVGNIYDVPNKENNNNE